MTNLGQKGLVRPGTEVPQPGWRAQLRVHCTYWETQAISSSVLNTIWLVLLLWTTSPFTRQQILKLCGSEMQNTSLGSSCPFSTQPASGHLGEFRRGCVPDLQRGKKNGRGC